MAGTSENNVATAAASPKWVTFHDVMDDAMEGGKLFPIKRRMSISGTSTTCSSSVSSYCSSVDAAAGSSSPTYKKTSFDFSQSLGYREDHELQERRKPQRSTTLASLSYDKYAAFSKLDKIQGRSKGWSGKVSCGSSQGPMGWSDEILGLSTDDDEPEEPEPAKMHLNIEDNWGGNPLHRSTWDRSPNRSFVRNFP